MKSPPNTSPHTPTPAPNEDAALNAVKAAFEAKAAEPLPEHLVSLVNQLETDAGGET